ncbi:MarR family winged helix-turn-helix transcriptional regulator [Marinobacterium sp. YM272]|uniref:MarR family winged helix-turn-helix transcriptional regulator n=1 Tax=Marinobacterium sp. YM272 TaxID=3421654 RepID=UPI003D7F38D2
MASYTHTQSLGHLTGLAGRLFNKLLTSRFQAAGIDMTAEQWGVVLLLVNHDTLTQGQIGEMLYLEKSTISRSITGLVKRGWVVCNKSAEDGRQRNVSLTPKAMKIVERCAEIASGVLRDAQQGLSENEIASNQQHLASVIGNLRQLNNNGTDSGDDSTG